jgi:hypothetical protein
MNTRTLTRRLDNLERRFGPVAEPMLITVFFVGPDGEREEGPTFQVGGNTPKSSQMSSDAPR